MSIRYSCILCNHSIVTSSSTSNYNLSKTVKENIPVISRNLKNERTGKYHLYHDCDIIYGFFKISDDYHLMCIATNDTCMS